MENIDNRFVPAIDQSYVKWGNYESIKLIVESKTFFPLWVTGLAGNGKTQMIEQACAEANRECIRINFTIDTDENDLIGTVSLVDGNTIYREGLLVTAMRRGSILLLDDIDMAHTNKLLCLLTAMEGKGILIKATGEFVKPSKGFSIFATSNTKGRGSEDGKFIGTQVLNGAFLDRFAGMIKQDYPDVETEIAILGNYLVDYLWTSKGIESESLPQKEVKENSLFIGKLCEWASQIRQSYANFGSEEVISTRALINIIQGYAIFGSREMALKMACERFPDATAIGMIDAYKKLDDTMFESKDGDALDELGLT